MIISIKVSPGAKKNTIKRYENGILYVSVSAPPEKGRANEALVALLSEKLGLKKNEIEIVGGETGRLKKIKVKMKESELKEHLTFHTTSRR